MWVSGINLVVRLGSKYLYPIHHLTNMFVSMFLTKMYTKKKKQQKFQEHIVIYSIFYSGNF